MGSRPFADYAQLLVGDLHASLASPVSESMNFLNEIALRYPGAVSLAAGRPYEGFFDLDDLPRYLSLYQQHLTERLSGDEERVRRTVLQYGRTKGVIHELVAEHLRLDEGINANPQDLVVTVGCQEALYLTLRALRRDERDVLLAVAPSYVGVHGAAGLVDMTLVPVRDAADGIDLNDLVMRIHEVRAQGRNPRACYVIPDFANPSGTRMSLETRRRLLRIAAEEDLLLLEDNPYGLFGDPDGPPTLKALDTAARVVYLGSFAKTGLPGARVGYVLADQRVVEAGSTAADGSAGTLADQLAKIKSMLTVNTSPIAQAVIGGKLLAHGCSLRRANVREIATYRDNLTRMLAGLERRLGNVPGVSWNAPEGGFFLLLTVPFPAGDDLLELCASTYEVLWTPVHHFYADTRPRNVVRLSFSHLRPEEIETGLDRLARFVRDQQQN
ncbi:PLP-dependent aminotransferase family protein [Kitasatospora aureofaciens]|uniref:Aminotransferase n=1 Tax=Kitasatospora aureofaciens TaxID=1894 RepID=A0A1E7N8J0_KITAU|nr:PLP-dependent aminotransferase family protein [Kitasatospora aureofaciens]ARF81724.1 GntR family transcriptional regulator [Kitasatospora aureofaciens]OEV37001.1 GntR family transcriptional regulator [Kitasatospora aureofaciens]UKZ03404.1 PLP-dependent aminotransferase family protein [Streptomyces viridifaciens]GGV07357.1 aminotransferase [Kitasatospora aureofaciens]